MTKQELREKIIKLIKEACLQHSNICTPNGDCRHCKYDGYKDCTEYAVADALITAGIGDVSEWKHRAEKEEMQKKIYCRALYNLSRKYVVSEHIYTIEDDDGKLYVASQELCAISVMGDEVKQAEKELQEERKDV